jgi:hypothetical protein
MPAAAETGLAVAPIDRDHASGASGARGQVLGLAFGASGL